MNCSGRGFGPSRTHRREEDHEMKRQTVLRVALLLLVCMLVLGKGDIAGALATTSALDYPVEGLTIDKLSTRSGPGTHYRETGTYKVQDQYVPLFSVAYDGSGVCWVQCDIPYGNKLRRLYTGLKRFDASTFDLSSLPEEDPMDFDERVRVLVTSKALYGPGRAYDVYDKLTVDKGQRVTVIAIQEDYAQVEWTTSKQSYRAWVLLSTLDY